MKTDINFLNRPKVAQNFSFSHFMVALAALIVLLIAHYQYLLNDIESRSQIIAEQSTAPKPLQAEQTSSKREAKTSAESLLFARLKDPSAGLNVRNLDIDHARSNVRLELEFTSRDALSRWLASFQERKQGEHWQVRGMNILDRNQVWTLRLEILLRQVRGMQ